MNRYVVDGALTGAKPDSDAERAIYNALRDVLFHNDMTGNMAEDIETSLRAVWFASERAAALKCAELARQEVATDDEDDIDGWTRVYNSACYDIEKSIRAAFAPDPTQEAKSVAD